MSIASLQGGQLVIQRAKSLLRQPITASFLAAYSVHDKVEGRLHSSVPSHGEDRSIVKREGQSEAAETAEVQERIRTGIFPFGVAGLFADTWVNNLDFRFLPSDLVDYYRRAGNEYRDLAGAEAVSQTIPHPIRMAGTDVLRDFHEERDWSHIVPRSLGGSDSASNGIFETASLNRARGAVTMTGEEHAQAQLGNVIEAVESARNLTVDVILTAALGVTVVEGALSIMEEGLRYYDGEISKAELRARVLKRLGKRVAYSVVIAGLVAGLAIAFPLFAKTLSALAIPLLTASLLMLGIRLYGLSAEWLQRVGLEPVLTASRQSKDGSKSAWQGVRRASNLAWQGANGVSNRALAWVG